MLSENYYHILRYANRIEIKLILFGFDENDHSTSGVCCKNNHNRVVNSKNVSFISIHTRERLISHYANRIISLKLFVILFTFLAMLIFFF